MDIPVAVLLTDARTAPGTWNLQIAASQMVAPGVHRVVKDAQLAVVAVNVTCAQPPCTLPRHATVTGPVPFNAIAATTFLTVGPSAGSGRLLVTPTLRLSIPASAYSGDYKFTLALTVVEGP